MRFDKPYISETVALHIKEHLIHAKFDKISTCILRKRLRLEWVKPESYTKGIDKALEDIPYFGRIGRSIIRIGVVNPEDLLASQNLKQNRLTKEQFDQDRTVDRRVRHALSHLPGFSFAFERRRDVSKGCMCCGQKHTGLESSRAFAIDHCHKTNVVRGAICFRCNTVLGRTKDSIPLLEALIAYLRDPPALRKTAS